MAPSLSLVASGLRRAVAGAALWVCALGLGSAGLPAFALGPPADPLPALDLREEVLRLPVTVRDARGRSETKSIAITHFRPPGDGPFPLVVMNHGRAVADKRAGQGRQRYEALARYFVSKGFAVFVPTRLGYGDTYGDFDPEASGGCGVSRLPAVAQAASEQVLAAVALAAEQPWVDARHWFVMGGSVGGFTSLAVAARHPPGLIGAVNFSGGHGGRPDTHPGDPCGPRAISSLWQKQAATATVPTLWLYWENDRYWGAEWPVRWAEAWREGGGQVEFHSLSAVGTDGHAGTRIDMARWVPLMETFLGGLGYTRPGLLARPNGPAARRREAADLTRTD